MAAFCFDMGMTTRTLPAERPLRMRVNMSAIGSCMLISLTPYRLDIDSIISGAGAHQLALTSPGTSPCMAASRSLLRPRPNFR